MSTTAHIIDQHRQAARWVGDGVTVECTCGHKSQGRYMGIFPLTEERNNHRDADRKHAAHVAEHLAAQEPTDAEVEAAYDALIAHNGPARELNEFHERCCVECGDAMSWPGKISDDGKRDRLHGMRAALSAARAARRDEETR